MSLENNPLYFPKNIPDFAKIQPEHIEAIFAIIEENRQAIETLLTQTEYSWDNLMLPLERMENRLAKAVSPIVHLHSVCSTNEWREAYEKVLPALSLYSSELGQNEALYQAIKSIKAQESFAQLDSTKQKIITDNLKRFEHSGVGLSDADKAAFKQNSLRLSELSTTFGNNVLDATNAWQLWLSDKARLEGVPDAVKALLKDLAKQQGKEGYLLTLDAPVVTPILAYAQDRALRQEIYEAYNARASELSDEGRFDNTEIIKEIIDLRQKQAQLLGFEDYAAYSVDSKMAESSESVLRFLEDLVERSRAQGMQDMAELQQFAAQELGIEVLEAWDISYASHQLRQAKYALSSEDLRPYFPINKVIGGMFEIARRLFAVRFRECESVSVWHEDVRAYEVLNAEDAVIATFYLDPYAREKKRGGAWMDGAAARFCDGARLQLPVVYLVCNFTPPVGEEQAYITHDEVMTLFHEFGHGLHQMLSKVEEYSAAGIMAVEWDAVEQPSQFMENFCYERECLDLLTAHKETGEKLPDALYEKLIASKHFQAALVMLRQMEFSLFDFRLHGRESEGKTALEVLKAVRERVAVTPTYANNRFPMQFAHIFAGGYAAGYYSYKWAEVLSADSFSAFEEAGIFDVETGARFRDEILAVGASRPSMESFIAFRGRAPEIGALLRHNGIGA